MYQLIYLDKEGNQIYLNVDTMEVAKINRKIQKSTQSKSKAALTMFGIVSFCTTMVRIVRIDTSSNKLALLAMVYGLAILLGVLLNLLSKKILTKELTQNKIDYSMDELTYWIETRKMDSMDALKLCGVFFFVTVIGSLIYYVDPTHVLLLAAIFVCCFTLSVLLPEPLRFYWRNKGKMKKICQENNIEY